MTRRCYSFQEAHRHAHDGCTFCGHMAVFHWKTTYPDLLLCAEHLKDFPEAQGRPKYDEGYRSQSEIEWLEGSR